MPVEWDIEAAKAAKAELIALAAEGGRTAEATGIVVSRMEDIAERGMDRAKDFAQTAGACEGLYVFREGKIVACAHIDGGPAYDPIDLVPLALGRIGRDGTEADICRKARGRMP